MPISGLKRRRYAHYIRSHSARRGDRAIVVTRTRDSNSSNRVGAAGLSKISTGRFMDMPTLWPDRLMVKLKYTDFVTSTITVGHGGYTGGVVYQVNSLTYPLYGGASPTYAGIQALSMMYNRFRVHAAKVTTTLVAQTTPMATGALAVSIFTPFSSYNPSTSPYTQVAAYVGDPYTVWAELPSTQTQPTVLENYVGMRKLSGCIGYSVENKYEGIFTNAALPTNPMLCTVLVSQPNTSSSDNVYSVVNQIEFWAELYGIIDPLN